MLRDSFKKSLLIRRLVRSHRLRTLQPNWGHLLAKDRLFWKSSLNAAKSQKILIATSIGAYLPGTILESLLAAGLTLRNVEIHVLLCDAVLPACLDCMLGITITESTLAKSGPQKHLCKDCFYNAYKMFCSLGVKIHRYSDFLNDEQIKTTNKISEETDLSKIENYTFSGLAVGEHALAGALRFYARGNLEGELYAEEILRRYLNAGLLTTFVINDLLEKYKFECVLFHHGIYVPQGLIGEVCRSKNIRIVNWNPAYKKGCFIFSHGDTYHHTLMNEPVDKWENIHWRKDMETALSDYLKSRWYGTKDWIYFQEKPEVNVEAISKKLGIDSTRPCIGLLTNVIWDAQLHYPANIFPDMVTWVVETINYFRNRTDLQLIIRIHPAELRGNIPSRQVVLDEINKHFPKLPKNIFIISPESRISTYAVMSKCNAVIIYGTKTGVELAAMGIPVIVAGEAWIRNKTITNDPKTQKDYFKLLDSLPLTDGMNQESIKRACKYAYHFFFRRMMPVKFVEVGKGGVLYRMNLSSIKDLLPNNRDIDVLFDGITKGTDFIYPSEHQYRSK